jgi:ABC-type nickel/cobalt efflux system permease component RcnA
LNLKRVLNLAAAIAAVAAAVAVCVVAAAYAVYALAESWLSPAGAAAVVAGVFALIAVVVAWAATRKVTPKTPAGVAQPEAPLDRVIAIAKERPLLAVGVGAVAAFVLVRNPAIVSAVVTSFLAGNATKPPPK